MTTLTVTQTGGKVIKRFRLSAAGDPIYVEPAWSPDESAVAVDDNGPGILVATLAGRVRALGRGVQPAWSPDSRRIAFVDALSDERGPHLAVMRRDGREHRLLVRNLDVSDCCVGRPVWSPDGRSIAFAFPFAMQDSRTDPAPQRWGIYVVRRDGSRFRRVAATPWIQVVNITPAWSPDGRSISFADNKGILIVPATGGKQRRLTTLGSDSETSWAPASRIVFIHRGDIYKVAPGRRPTLVLR
jgi:Tol biopolymer transport system component